MEAHQMCLPHLMHLSLYFVAQELQRNAWFLAKAFPHFTQRSPFPPAAQNVHIYAMALANGFPQMMHFSFLEPNPHELHNFAFVEPILFLLVVWLVNGSRSCR